MCCPWKGDFSFNELYSNINCLAKTYWFVTSYLLLYLFSPLLNSFSENAEKKELLLFIIVFYIAQTYCQAVGRTIMGHLCSKAAIRLCVLWGYILSEDTSIFMTSALDVGRRWESILQHRC